MGQQHRGGNMAKHPPRFLTTGFWMRVTLFFLFLGVVSTALWAGTAKLHIDVGLNHFYKKRYLEAFKEFQAAVEIDPRDTQAHYNLARVYRIQGFLKEAVAEYETAISLDSGNQSARRELVEIKQTIQSDVGTRLKIEGQDEAVRQRASVGDQTPSQRRGEEYLKKGDVSRAITEFEAAINADPNNPKLYKLLGYLHFQLNRYSNALSAYSQAFKLSPQDAEIPYSIGMIHLRTQNPEEALNWLKKAIEQSPDMVKAQYGLGEVYEALGQNEDALFQYRKCLNLSPNLAQAEARVAAMAAKLGMNYFSRGVFYYEQGDYEKAEALISLAEKHGGMTTAQVRQAEEILTASRYWLGKKRVEMKENQDRQEVRENSYINKELTVRTVAGNISAYIGQSVQWSGWGISSRESGGKTRTAYNSSGSTNSDSNMDYCFEVVFPKGLPNDPRISDYSHIEVKGKVLGAEKIPNGITNIFSSRKQPVVEATEATFSRENYEEPLVVRFY